MWVRLQKEYLKSKRVFSELQISVIRLYDSDERYIESESGKIAYESGDNLTRDHKSRKRAHKSSSNLARGQDRDKTEKLEKTRYFWVESKTPENRQTIEKYWKSMG